MLQLQTLTMKITRNTVTYAFQITKVQMLTILKRGGIEHSLYRRLMALSVVEDVKYDGHFGACLWVTFAYGDKQHPVPRVVKQAKQIIQDFIDGQ